MNNYTELVRIRSNILYNTINLLLNTDNIVNNISILNNNKFDIFDDLDKLYEIIEYFDTDNFVKSKTRMLEVMQVTHYIENVVSYFLYNNGKNYYTVFDQHYFRNENCKLHNIYQAFINKLIPINTSVLYYALKLSLISLKDLTNYINNNYKKLSITEKEMIEFNLLEEDKKYFSYQFLLYKISKNNTNKFEYGFKTIKYFYIIDILSIVIGGGGIVCMNESFNKFENSLKNYLIS